MTTNNKADLVCSDDCEPKTTSSGHSCKLTTPELRKRKETVLTSLKSQLIEKKELILKEKTLYTCTLKFYSFSF